MTPCSQCHRPPHVLTGKLRTDNGRPFAITYCRACWKGHRPTVTGEGLTAEEASNDWERQVGSHGTALYGT